MHPSSRGPPKSSAVRSRACNVGAGGAVVDDDAFRGRRRGSCGSHREKRTGPAAVALYGLACSRRAASRVTGAGRSCSTTSRVGGAPQPHRRRRARTASGKTTLLRILAGTRGARRGAGSSAHRRRATVGYLPQEPDARPARRSVAYLARRTGVAAAERRARPAARRRSTDDPALRRRLHRRARALPRARRRRPRRPRRRGVRRLGLADDRLRPRDGRAVGRPGGAAPRSPRSCSSRFDVFLLDEPTNDLDFAGLDRLERFLDELAGRASSSCRHDRAFLDRDDHRVLELDEHDPRGDRVRGRLAAIPRERGDPPAASRRGATPSTRPSAARLATGPARSGSGRCRASAKAKKKPRDNDKHIRDFRVNRSEKQAAKAKITERALERLEVVDKPWEGWELQLRARAPRRAAATSSPGSTARSSSAATSRSGPSTSRSAGRAGRDPRARTAAARPRCSQALLGELPLAAGRALARAGRRRRRARPGPRPLRRRRRRCSTRSTPRAGCSPARPGRCSPSSGSAPTTCCGPAATLSPGERSRADARPADGPGRELPRARRAHQPPRPARPSSSSSRRSTATKARCCSSPTTAGCSTPCASRGASSCDPTHRRPRMKIYTRKGDDGTTGLLYGGRVRKDSARPAAYGAVDEAQAALGLARAECRARARARRAARPARARPVGADGRAGDRAREPAQARCRAAALVTAEMVAAPRAADRRRRPRASSRRPSSSCPARTAWPPLARRGPHRRAPGRARVASPSPPTGSHVVPYLNRLVRPALDPRPLAGGRVRCPPERGA